MNLQPSGNWQNLDAPSLMIGSIWVPPLPPTLMFLYYRINIDLLLHSNDTFVGYLVLRIALLEGVK